MTEYSPRRAAPKTPFKVKLFEDGRAALNLGCGTRMHRSWNNLDFSPYIRLAQHPGLAKVLKTIGFISEERYQRLGQVDPQAIYWDLLRGIPFADDTFDLVYQAHLLEHFDRQAAPEVLKECWRVLKKGGVLRVVVPDLEILVNRYIESVNLLKAQKDEAAFKSHAQAIYDLFEQMVRGERAGTSQQRQVVRFLENLIRGDAARSGEVHRWMYDAFSLERLLAQVGFKDIRVQTPFTSRIQGWTTFHLDTEADGTISKPDSLYLEGAK